MVNEHRPYLPVALVSMLWIFGLVSWYKSWKAPALRTVGLVLVAIWMVTLGYLTVQRNKAFLTVESYWKDVLDKAPSARAHVNYGLSLLQSGRTADALSHFQSSLSLAPNYHVAHINTAIALSTLGRKGEADFHYDRAVDAGRGDGLPYLWRARHFIETGRYQEALTDLESAEEESNDKATIYLIRARALAWSNRGEEAAGWTLKAGELDFQKLGTSIVEVANPFFRDGTTAAEGVLFFDRLIERWPEVWWLHQNRGDLLLKLGKTAEAEKDLRLGRELKW
jgi:tetratricopeptide (TPR) repeat protein